MTFRAKVLTDCGASGSVLEELLGYTENPYSAHDGAPEQLPLGDEAHVETWSRYQRDADEQGDFAALRDRLVQLRFPVREGISGEAPYRKATRKGDVSGAEAYAPGLELRRPESVELTVCPTIAGRIPVLVAGERDDFVALVRACSGRNEPVPVPDSMGACFISGFNNWDRIASYRAEWEAKQPQPPGEAEWNEEFRRLVPRKDLYQDRFIILSRGPYSAVSAVDTGFDDVEWLEHSLSIRREHEFTHYFTYRVFGLIRSNALDELIADFNGLVRTFGTYRADLALRFLGLESLPRFRAGGRLGDYLGDPPLSGRAFEVLQALAQRVVKNLADLSDQEGGLLRSLEGLATVTYALAGMGFEELASDEMLDRANERIAGRDAPAP